MNKDNGVEIGTALEIPALGEFRDRVDRATVLLRQALDLLEPYLPTTPPEDLAPVPHEFPKAAESMLEAYRELPKAAVLYPAFDAAKVETDLRYARLVGPLADTASHLATRLGNHHRIHLAGAYTQVLPLYRVAKAAATVDQSLARLVKPLQAVFAKRR